VGLGCRPVALPRAPDLTISGTAAPSATLTAMLVVIVIGGLLLAPSLWLLFRVFKSGTQVPGSH
jgi:cytochrome bd-type quinol oxidase subunit 2